MHELIKEIERQLEMDRIEEGNMSVEDVLYIVKGFKRPYLNENQQKYLKQLQYNHERLGNTHDALFFGLVDYEKRWNFNDENFAQVLQVFSQWALEQEEE
ncbi:TPA: hypothetical protein ACNHTC_002792 [Enterococcus faecalis]